MGGGVGVSACAVTVYYFGNGCDFVVCHLTSVGRHCAVSRGVARTVAAMLYSIFVLCACRDGRVPLCALPSRFTAGDGVSEVVLLESAVAWPVGSLHLAGLPRACSRLRLAGRANYCLLLAARSGVLCEL